MAVLKVSDNSEMIISCKCGCDDGLRIKIEKDEEDYCFMTYLSGNWYKEQAGFIKKLKKYGIRIFIILKLYSIRKIGKSIKSGSMKNEKILSRGLGNRLSFIAQQEVRT